MIAYDNDLTASGATTGDPWGATDHAGTQLIVFEAAPDPWEEEYKTWKRQRDAEHAEYLRSFWPAFSEIRGAFYGPLALLRRVVRVGRRTREGCQRNATRQLPTVGAW